MLVDVIIPTYNRAYCLDRAISSVLNQSYKHFHLHIVDDGSQDHTKEILQAYENHPQVKLHWQNNRGVSSARNLAVKNSNSPWISFLDSDDEWHKHKLQKQMDYLTKNTQYRFLHADEIWIRNNKRVNPKTKHLKSNQDLFKRSLEFCVISPSTVIMRRELFFEHGPFDESLVVCEDYDLWLKILVHEEVGFLAEFVTTKYGGNTDQLSTQFVAMDYWRIKSLIKILKLPLITLGQKEMIIDQIKLKSVPLLKGYLKYQNHEHYQEMRELVKPYLGSEL